MADQTTPGGPETTRQVPVFVPSTDIQETKGDLVVSMDLPGANAESVNVTLEKRVLTVTARNQALPPEGCTLAHAEYRDGDYERSFTLSEAVDGERVEASMKNGVLKLIIPKAVPARAKTVSVKAS